jgi:bifunctional DNA-binding transcriptional regulator/antitoxin component of YhaV-PrlF toxin-antitoxin module
VPAELRRKHGIRAGTKVKFLEDSFGRIVLQPVTEEYIARVRGCLKGSNLLESWLEEHRAEGEKDKF